MSNNVSANALFHFTNTIENISTILTTGFYPRCCMEKLDTIYHLDNEKFSPSMVGIPMICFCDIPLAQIHNHSKNYGGYAIGLSKEWGKKNGINPVLYELPHSNAMTIIKECLKTTIPHLLEANSGNMDKNNEIKEIGRELLFFLCYLKPYEGQKWDGKGFSGDNIKFYDEREWRYIPDYNKICEKSIKPYIFVHDYMDKNKKEAYNQSLERNFKLGFEIQDIKYIIVKTENDILKMADRIESLRNEFSKEDQKILMTKIISLERIQQDF